MSNVARDNSHDNIFKAMKDITFEKTVSHQCGVTMSDSVEARAIAEFMDAKPGVTVTYNPALIRIDGSGKLIFKMDEISEFLGRENPVRGNTPHHLPTHSQRQRRCM